MYLKTALEVIVAFFCIIGIYSSWRMISQRIFGDKNIIIAVEIYSDADADKADVLLREALDLYLALPSERIVVLTEPDLLSNENLIGAAKEYGVSIYVTDI